VSDWQPIETAPKDGRAILLLSTGDTFTDPFDGSVTDRPPQIAIGKWCPEGTSWVDRQGGFSGPAYDLAVTGVWSSEGGWFQPNEVTHWQPLPPPPGDPS